MSGFGLGSDHYFDRDGNEHYCLYAYQPWPQRCIIQEYDTGEVNVGEVTTFAMCNGIAKYRVISKDEYGSVDCELIESTYTPYERTLTDDQKADRKAWALKCAENFEALIAKIEDEKTAAGERA